MKTQPLLLRFFCRAVLSLLILHGALSGVAWADASWADDEPAFGEERNIGTVLDPLEPLNRVFFQFNDRLYFWALKPLSQGYAYFIADDVRMCVRDFFRNLGAPVRIVNNFLQGKFQQSGVETARFLINFTVGIVGLADPAKNEFALQAADEDLGQTFGTYGVGEGIYLCLPFFGPSNLRDVVGMAGDAFLSPTTYVGMSDTETGVAVEAGRKVNATSLAIGDYEDFKESALDPYIAMRDAYRQNRSKKIRDMVVSGDALYSSVPREQAWKEASMASGPFSQTVMPPPKGITPHSKASGAFVDESRVPFGEASFIEIAAAANVDQLLQVQHKLNTLHRDFFVQVYQRGNTRYFGILVPAGSSGNAAKQKE